MRGFGPLPPPEVRPSVGLWEALVLAAAAGGALLILALRLGTGLPSEASGGQPLDPEEIRLVEQVGALRESIGDYAPLRWGHPGVSARFLASGLELRDGWADPEPERGFGGSTGMILAARGASIGAFLMALSLLWFSLRRRLDRETALLGCLLAVLAPVSVQHVPAGAGMGWDLLAAVALTLATVRFLVGPPPGSDLLTGYGMAMGLVLVSGNLPLLPLALLPPLAALLSQRSPGAAGWGRAAVSPDVWQPLLVAVVVWAALTPWAVTEPRGYWNALVDGGRFLQREQLWNDPGVTAGGPGLRFLAARLLPASLGWPLLAASLWGLIAAFWRRDRLDGALLLTLGAALAGSTLDPEKLGPGAVAWVPAAAILAARGIRGRPGARLSAVRSVALLSTLGGSLLLAGLLLWWLRLPDPRLSCSRWLQESLPAGAMVATAAAGPGSLPPVLTGRVAGSRAQQFKIWPIQGGYASLERSRARWFVGSRQALFGVFDKYVRRPGSFPREADLLQGLLEDRDFTVTRVFAREAGDFAWWLQASGLPLDRARTGDELYVYRRQP